MFILQHSVPFNCTSLKQFMFQTNVIEFPMPSCNILFLEKFTYRNLGAKIVKKEQTVDSIFQNVLDEVTIQTTIDVIFALCFLRFSVKSLELLIEVENFVHSWDKVFFFQQYEN